MGILLSVKKYSMTESSRWSVTGGSGVGGDNGREGLGCCWLQGLDGHPARRSLARSRHHGLPVRRGWELGGGGGGGRWRVRGGDHGPRRCCCTLAELNGLLTSAAHEQNLLWGVPAGKVYTGVQSNIPEDLLAVQLHRLCTHFQELGT